MEKIIDYSKNGHKILVEKVDGKIRLIKNGEPIIETSGALLLSEDGYSPVYYIQFNDARGHLEPSETHSTCPYKGKASYYSLKYNNVIEKDKVWRYCNSTEEFEKIRDYVAFYPDAIDKIERIE